MKRNLLKPNIIYLNAFTFLKNYYYVDKTEIIRNQNIYVQNKQSTNNIPFRSQNSFEKDQINNLKNKLL